MTNRDNWNHIGGISIDDPMIIIDDQSRLLHSKDREKKKSEIEIYIYQKINNLKCIERNQRLEWTLLCPKWPAIA